jgi:hypothetical protein
MSVLADSGVFRRGLGWLGWFWGLAGFLAVLVYAIVRLAPIAWHSLQQPLGVAHWLVFGVNLLMMAYYEGYKGFQKGYSPRVVARAEYLRAHPRLLLVLLAPAFCMGYFHSTRRRMIAAWVLTVSIVILVILIRLLPQPWRGLLDAGVVLGLSWGLVATLAAAVQVMWGGRAPVNPELPELPERGQTGSLDQAGDSTSSLA